MADGRSLIEIQTAFPDDEACAEFLIERRWPNGFFCPSCGGLQGDLLRSRAYTYQCRYCKKQTSITAGTVMHRTKLPLTKWFWAAHLMATHSNGISALQLRSQLDVTYKTAWLLANKLRRCMVNPNREMLEGVIEIDQTEIPFRNTNTFFDPRKSGKITIIGAAEIIDRYTQKRAAPKRIGAKYHDVRSGCIRLEAIPDNSKGAITAFVEANIAKGSTLISDGHRSYVSLEGYRLDPRDVKNMAGHIVLPTIHRVFSLMKRWGLGTYHGLRLAHIDEYLNEFAFRYNRRFYRHVSFEAMLGLGTQHHPISYWDIVGHESTRTKPPKRKLPRRRKTAFGMRPDKQTKPAKPDSQRSSGGSQQTSGQRPTVESPLSGD